MKSRLIAAAAMGVAVVLGATGCSMISPQGTTIQYSAADGINVPDHGAPLLVRNALVIANADGTIGNLVAAVINDTDDAHTLTVEVGDGATPQTVHVRGNSVVSLGNKGTDPLRLEGIAAKPGATLSLSFQSGDATPVVVQVPVLDDGERIYNGLVPTPTPTVSPTSTPTPDPSATAG